jgi:nucleotide-binding universal stress UspA family protein
MLRPVEAAEQPVLVAYDGSAAARQAVVEAARLLRTWRAIVVTVWEPGLAYDTASLPPDGMMMAPMVEPGAALEVDRAVHDQAERVAREGAELARSLGLDAEPLAVPDEGDVPHTIVKLAQERGAAAIVAGSRGLGGLRARLEGSTSKGLVKHAPCPIVVVHEAPEGE